MTPKGDVLFALQHQGLQNSPKYLPMHKDVIVCPNKIFHLDKAYVVIFPWEHIIKCLLN